MIKFQLYVPYIWLAAFFCSFFFIHAWQLPLFLSAVVLVSVWCVISLYQQSGSGLRIPKSWCLGFMGAFGFLSFLSVLGSDILNVSFMAFCFFSVLPLTFSTFVVCDTDEFSKIIGRVLIGLFVILALWALVQFFVFNEYFQGRATHPLKNPNSLAAVFSLSFIWGIGLLLHAKERKHKIWFTALCCLIFAAFVAAGSRGALLALVPVMALFLFVMRDIARENWRCLAVITVFSILALSLFDLFGTHAQNLMGRVLHSLALQDEDISNNRFALWQATIDIIKEHGLLGTGIGTFFLYFPEFRLPSDRYGAFYAHNDPLQYWVELGILGPVLFYSFVIAVVGRTVQAVQKSEDAQATLRVLTPFFALGACVIHTHMTFNFYNLSILFLAGFLLSAWFIETQKILKTKVWTVQFPATYSPLSRFTMIALPFVLILTLFGAYVVSEHYTNKARDHLLAGELEPFAEDVLRANAISMQGNYRSYLLAVNVPMTLLQEQSDMLSTEQKKDLYDQAMAYLKQVQFINPRSASAHFYLAKIQQLVPSQFIEEGTLSAQEFYERALKLDPIHIGARIGLSFIYEKELLSMDRAIKLMEEGMDYRYNTAKAMDLYGRMAQLYLKAGHAEGRDLALQKMRNFQAYLDRHEERKSRRLMDRFSTGEARL